MNCYLDMRYDDKHFVFNFNNILNAIVGESCSGKTTLVKVIQDKLYDELKSNYNPVVISDVRVLSTVRDKDLLLIDVDNADIDIIKNLSNFKDKDIVIVTFGRKYLHNLPIPAGNLYTINYNNNVVKNAKLDIPMEYVGFGAYVEEFMYTACVPDVREV